MKDRISKASKQLAEIEKQVIENRENLRVALIPVSETHQSAVTGYVTTLGKLPSVPQAEYDDVCAPFNKVREELNQKICVLIKSLFGASPMVTSDNQEVNFESDPYEGDISVQSALDIIEAFLNNTEGEI